MWLYNVVVLILLEKKRGTVNRTYYRRVLANKIVLTGSLDTSTS